MAKNKYLKKSIIYGGGAIGSILAASLIKSNDKVFFLCRNDNYKKIKADGLNIEIYNNSKIKNKIFLKKSKKFIIIKNINEVKNQKIDYIFITTKINQNLTKIFVDIEKYVSEKTLIITPCTSIPFWWFKCLNQNLQNKFEKKLHYLFKKNIDRKNLVGMTMWLSGKIQSPGSVIISHVQRGFPIKEVFFEKKEEVDKLRNKIKKLCISPKVKNIFSEIFIKSLNSLAFNMIALKYQQNNLQLSNNSKAINETLRILNEGDKILKKYKIKISQSPLSRVIQTLKSKKHTMSMLNAFKEKKDIELKSLWKSFEELNKYLNTKMVFAKRTYNYIVNKIL